MRNRRSPRARALAAAGLLSLSALPVAASSLPAAAAPVVGANEIAAPTSEQLLDLLHVGDSVVRFVHHGAIDIVGVYEIKPLGAPSVLASLAGGTKTVEQLHVELRAAAREPAADRPGSLSAGRSASTTSTGPSNGSCTYHEAFAFNSHWASNWYYGHKDSFDVTAQASYHKMDLKGHHGVTWSAGKSFQRKMGACNGSFGGPNNYAWDSAFEFQPEVRINGSWHSLTSVPVDLGHEAVYYSGHGPDTWRLRIRECLSATYHCHLTPNLYHDMAVGVAVDRPLPLKYHG